MEFTTNDKALEAKARRAAIKVDLRAKKSRDRSLHASNHGGFMLIDPSNNTGIIGWNYELSAEEVLDYCRALLAERYKAERDGAEP